MELISDYIHIITYFWEKLLTLLEANTKFTQQYIKNSKLNTTYHPLMFEWFIVSHLLNYWYEKLWFHKSDIHNFLYLHNILYTPTLICVFIDEKCYFAELLLFHHICIIVMCKYCFSLVCILCIYWNIFYFSPLLPIV